MAGGARIAVRLALPWLCLCVVLNAATGVPVPQLSAFDDLMNGLLKKWQLPGAALGVSHKGRLVLAHGYGRAEADGGLPVQPDWVFRIDGIKPIGDTPLGDTPIGQATRGLAGDAAGDAAGGWTASVSDLLHGTFPQPPQHLESHSAGAYFFRQAATGVDVVLLFNFLPSDSQAFESDVSAALVNTVNSITKWPPIDLFVTGPELFAGDIVNAADYSGGRVAPGEIVVLFPSNAGPPEMADWHLDADGKAAVPVGATRVFFDGIAAAVVYSLSGQVCAVVPNEVAHKKTTEVVIEYGGVRSPPVMLPVAASAPALFTLDASGKGQAAMLNETGCCNSVRNPAPRGTVVSLYGTGEGQTEPQANDRTVSVPGRPAQLWVPQLPVTVTVGGVPAEVNYVRNIGLLQVNVRVPANAPTGDAVPLVLTVGNTRSSDRVTMAIRSRSRLVLVVDHDAAIRTRLAAILKGAGYEVVTARDGREAGAQASLVDRHAAQAQSHPVDLVIADLAMPEAEGLEMIGSLRNQQPKLKIIATSAAFGPKALRAADMLGAQAVLRKPLIATAVRRRVHDLLQEPPARY
jgi:uncharacterized protein (TIGR03437 family)